MKLDENEFEVLRSKEFLKNQALISFRDKCQPEKNLEDKINDNRSILAYADRIFI